MQLVLTVLLVFSLQTGCGLSQISRHGYPDIQGEIVGQVDGYYVVKTNRGTELAIAGRDVTEIDRPGNVAATLGIITSIISLGFLAGNSEGTGVVLLLGGLGLTTGGLMDYGKAVNAEKKDLSNNPRYAAMVPGHKVGFPPPNSTQADEQTAANARTESAPSADALPPPAPTSEGLAQHLTRGGQGAKPDQQEPTPSRRAGAEARPASAGFTVPAPAPKKARVSCPDTASEAKATAAPSDIAASCVANCLGGSPTCMEHCIASQLTAPRGCVRCYATQARCRAFVCTQECMPGSTTCSACVSEHCADAPSVCSSP